MADEIPFSGGAFDRAAHLRRDEAFLSAAPTAPDVKVMVLRAGAVLVHGAHGDKAVRLGDIVTEGARAIAWRGGDVLELAPTARRLFLGQDADGAPCFALDLPPDAPFEAPEDAGFEDPRAAASFLPPVDSRLTATARSIFAWHQRHGYCSNCGAATLVDDAGWKRTCAACGGDHFPRVDPVAIMLAVRGDKCLLGRHAGWKPNYWSCLAGFIEPGETPEQGAARELFEETGVVAAEVCDYLFCQPWPYPSNLMIGMIIEAASEKITVDEKEIAEARWFTRNEARAMLQGVHQDVCVPPPVSAAHHIIRRWAEGG